MNLKKFFSIMSAMLLAACGSRGANPENVEVVAPEAFVQQMNHDDSAYLLDVRTPQEYAQGHLPGAAQLDWLNTANFKQQAPQMLDKDKTIYVYCRSGHRSNQAAQYLADLGYKVVDMKGGILAYENENLPLSTSE